MADIVQNCVTDVFTRWGAAMDSAVGEGNYSSRQVSTIASTPYAVLFMLSNPTTQSDLEGDEVATTPSFQVECYASGQKALSKVYSYDEVSHAAMVGMGFRRTYGAEIVENVDSNIIRCVSRYSRIYTGQLLE